MDPAKTPRRPGHRSPPEKSLTRRAWLARAATLCGLPLAPSLLALEGEARPASLKITGLRVTPIALPDPPILAASGCHGPYFLRNVIELETDAGITGIGETHGGEAMTRALESAKEQVVGRSPFAYRALRAALAGVSPAAYAGLELACLDAAGRATRRRLCELLGGPVREEVELAAYLFYRYAADHPALLADPHLADDRGHGDRALDSWGEVRSPEAMVAMAAELVRRHGFKVLKLKGGVLAPDVELETMRALAARFGRDVKLRIDPNARWTMPTALRIGRALRDLTLEYYEDPVEGQEAMAEARRETGLSFSTNMCVTRFEHILPAIETRPIDVVLGDHHVWGGIPALQELGRICRTVGWTLGQHSNSHTGITMAAMAHIGASVPELAHASDTHYPWLVEGADILHGPKLAIRDGAIAVPAGPGLGVDLDRDRLARAHETYQKSGMRRRDDASTMRRVEPGWSREPL